VSRGEEEEKPGRNVVSLNEHDGAGSTPGMERVLSHPGLLYFPPFRLSPYLTYLGTKRMTPLVFKRVYHLKRPSKT
jgi:hypothetical protein